MHQVEVAVIGAGAAGLAAAAMLRAAGVEALLLEARDRIGGRAHTDLADPAAPFDRGASYMHAADQGNPWLDIALAHRAPLQRDPRRRAILRAGQPLPLAPYQDAVAAAWEALAAARPGTSAGAVLPARSAADHYARALVGPWLSGADTDGIDAADFAAARDGEDWLVPGGYGRLVAAFGGGLPVRLGCPVAAIRTRDRAVEIDTACGALRAQQAIVTVPLGVLAAERIRFSPALPTPVVAALGALPMGNLAKLRVRLAGDPFACGDMVYAATPPTGEKAILWLIRPFGRNELMGFAGGGLAAELAALSPAEIADVARRELVDLGGANVARSILGCTWADWSQDPWALGSYASARPGAAEARAALRLPWSDRVRYAGEAAAAGGWHGTVAGAYLSGRDAARAVLAAGSGTGGSPRPPIRPRVVA